MQADGPGDGHDGFGTPSFLVIIHLLADFFEFCYLTLSAVTVAEVMITDRYCTSVY